MAPNDIPTHFCQQNDKNAYFFPIFFPGFWIQFILPWLSVHILSKMGKKLSCDGATCILTHECVV